MAEPRRLELTRHFVPLSPEETDEAVGLVSGMIVRYLQAKGDARKPGGENEAVKAVPVATEVRS